MKTGQFRTYDLYNERPKVLLMGNGLTYNSSLSWQELIRRVCREGADVSQYEKTAEDSNRIMFCVPNSILTLATSDINDKERHEKYINALNQVEYLENNDIRRLMGIPFDAVLTTNYTYELEAALNPHYPGLKPASKRRYALTTKTKADTKYLLHTFNRILPAGPDIWHIHGELRCPSSMVLSHDEYARYINCILQYNKDRGNEYVNYKQELKFKSWVDYFLQGDVYVLGLGMDYSEFDLWWLLGRRLRENAGCGKFIFYEPMKAENRIKQCVLRDCGVQVENCDINLDTEGTHNAFYQTAIKDIENRIKGKNKERCSHV